MMYHAESFAKHGFSTYIVGYAGSTPTPSLLELPLVRFLYLPPPPPLPLPFLISGPLKVAQQAVGVLYALLARVPHTPEYLLVQNPPSIPTLALVALVASLRGTKVIIDWHNLGYSILALRLGSAHPLIRIAKQFEKTFGRTAYAHLFVTRAMRDHLVKEWDLRGITAVLHDRPPAHFRRASPVETHRLFLALAPSLPTPFLPPSSAPYSTPFTTVAPESPGAELPLPSPRADRPALVVSSTSWTPDEDFSVLLSALGKYERAARAPGARLPKVLCVVTGRGPQREMYMGRVGRMQRGEEGSDGAWRWVRCVSLWLEAEDYPVLLGSADVGVSLHASSSALDLPMKVVDMFGCGLPVCALDFACLPELVEHGRNGLVFRTDDELSEHLQTLLRGFPAPSPALSALQGFLRGEHPQGTADEQAWGSWDENWNAVVRRLVMH
ncbi:glycosyl transferases group 1-domain-containing protein [Vararia minispora EC-137]|uniref:Glycosyl transferases group 1-domain-containing protein n=1 Tax=Vararia minispora EC-137 TaxID=1314806 RepID=A0ACB8QTU7_9AGAM|nr:glycosyl transferases group 1-domain-containing protein [Vararia minispora EC-137]